MPLSRIINSKIKLPELVGEDFFHFNFVIKVEGQKLISPTFKMNKYVQSLSNLKKKTKTNKSYLL